ncbi:hypothetical protein AO366_0446 [Moraxella catarrhalis]|uniref:Uncharacterized protein n=1 Tax=Moraxella catarrhalis TaxID=480 RepID=A0AB36DKV2_MORCA|nr:hypothetical protein AO379_1161 [Moraxella catarrhalis]OAV13696.1 hypothetical protein AO376_1454 [Moraxella catarrhalis]OAV20552.1 hypothetical protein AO374_0425 [Moraxella catarrhalis]OAV20978.1 hypothetical protein AO372_1309 [Moraxella catarrhalis]OAV22519.1 hypothetical protein AO370_1970 [Moraxella catarrhalis]
MRHTAYLHIIWQYFDKFTKDLQIVSDFYLKVLKFCGSIYTR